MFSNESAIEMVAIKKHSSDDEKKHGEYKELKRTEIILSGRPFAQHSPSPRRAIVKLIHIDPLHSNHRRHIGVCKLHVVSLKLSLLGVLSTRLDNARVLTEWRKCARIGPVRLWQRLPSRPKGHWSALPPSHRVLSINALLDCAYAKPRRNFGQRQKSSEHRDSVSIRDERVRDDTRSLQMLIADYEPLINTVRCRKCRRRHCPDRKSTKRALTTIATSRSDVDLPNQCATTMCRGQ
uniref:Uncharacterized protein n=1 Tax=Steinernema glaseri TaxID=37863 RepID=A0A1I8AEY9_9BILA